jgi:hypothetical protein
VNDGHNRKTSHKSIATRRFFVAQLKAPSLFLTAKTGVSEIHGMKNYP